MITNVTHRACILECVHSCILSLLYTCKAYTSSTALTIYYTLYTMRSGLYNYTQGKLEYITDYTNTISIRAVFNSKLRSWDYDWSSNRWKGLEKHVLQVYQHIGIYANCCIVVYYVYYVYYVYVYFISCLYICICI